MRRHRRNHRRNKSVLSVILIGILSILGIGIGYATCTALLSASATGKLIHSKKSIYDYVLEIQNTKGKTPFFDNTNITANGLYYDTIRSEYYYSGSSNLVSNNYSTATINNYIVFSDNPGMVYRILSFTSTGAKLIYLGISDTDSYKWDSRTTTLITRPEWNACTLYQTAQTWYTNNLNRYDSIINQSSTFNIGKAPSDSPTSISTSNFSAKIGALDAYQYSRSGGGVVSYGADWIHTESGITYDKKIWMITKSSSNNRYAFRVNGDGFEATDTTNSRSGGFTPVFEVINEVYTTGTGKPNDPFVIHVDR